MNYLKIQIKIDLFKTIVMIKGYSNLKNYQKEFNVDNGMRVHQRGGMKDGIMYNTCFGLIIVGGAMWAQTVYSLAFPQK